MSDIKKIIDTLELLAEVYVSPRCNAYLLSIPEWPEQPQGERCYSLELRNHYAANQDVLEFLQCRLVNIATLAETLLGFLKSTQVISWVDSLMTEAEQLRSAYRRLLDATGPLSEKEKREIISHFTARDKIVQSSWSTEFRDAFKVVVDLITRLYKDRKRCRPGFWATSPLPFEHERRLNQKRSDAWEDLKYTRAKKGV
jgi:hypothetical protein